jgi:signal transduction histidine kinase
MIAEAMSSQWLAVEAGADLLARARQIQKSWERLLPGGALDSELPPEATTGLRPVVVESWRRALATGLDPTDLLPSIEADPYEMRERWLEHPLGLHRHVLVAQLQLLVRESGSLVQVTDPSGLTLHLDGVDWLKERAAEMNLVEGARCSETVNGTNGVGTALAVNHPVQVFAFEHFSHHHREWVCSGAPIHDPVSGRLVGVIDLSSPWKFAHPRSLELVTTAARTMEQCLFENRRDQDARLRRRYGDLTTKGTDLLVNGDGYVLVGDNAAHSKPLDLPQTGGEIVLDDGSLAVAEPLGQGEAYLVRRLASRRASAAREALEPARGHVALGDISPAKQAENHLRELIEEQAALRRVATIVARESSPQQLFALVAEQVARIVNVPVVRVLRYEPDGSAVEFVGGWGESVDPIGVGRRWLLDGPSVLASVWRSGRSARLDDHTDVPGQAAALVREAAMRSAVASPIVVGRRLWGAIAALSPKLEPLPEDTEARLSDFTELVATAIANAESGASIHRLAGEQAALRRVATLVAEGAAPATLFSAVTEEVAGLFEPAAVTLNRYDGDACTVVAASGIDFPVGSRWPLDVDSLAARVYTAGRPVHVANYRDIAGATPHDMWEGHPSQSELGIPIIVDGSLWGVFCVATPELDRNPSETAERIGGFTELVATAIANSEARDRLRRLLDEQAALRRVATLVAEGASAGELFSAVAQEVAGVLGIPVVGVHRYEVDATFTMVAVAGDSTFTVGSRWPVADEGLSGMILASGRPARKDDYSTMPGPVGAAIRKDRMVSMVGVPIVVDGGIWGFMVAGGGPGEAIPAGTEDHLARFTELVATAVSNTAMRAELAASRARVIAAADEARRRIERDLHDGAQQQLVSLALGLRAAQARVPAGLEDIRAEVGRFADRLTSVVEELREMSHGIHPAILTEGGLWSAIESLVLRSSVPVKLNACCEGRLPAEVEVAAYYVVAEALTNAAKHADASHVQVDLHAEEETLRLLIVDDGSGGADSSGGSGLIGLKDRVEALGGTIEVDSPPGSGTRLDVEIPLTAEHSESQRLSRV